MESVKNVTLYSKCAFAVRQVSSQSNSSSLSRTMYGGSNLFSLKEYLK